MSMDSSREDRTLLETWDRLSRAGEAALNESEPDRESAELFALLPYELEPVVPRRDVWERIRAGIAAEAPARSEPKVVRFPQRSEPPAGAAPASRTPLAAPASRGGWAMAAALAVCLLGVGYLLATVRFQSSAIERLESDLTAAHAANAEMTRIRDQYAMINRVARLYYPLRPMSASPSRDPVIGRVWVCGQHQQWLLNVEGLKPAPPGYEYRFWFETGDGKVAAGSVKVVDGEARLSAPSMPVGTRGFSVTLERQDSEAERPEGEVVLRGEEPQQIVLGFDDLGSEAGDLSL